MGPDIRSRLPDLRRSLFPFFSSRGIPAGLLSRIVLLVVVCVSISSAVGLWQSYSQNYRARWNSPSHDRNAHYFFAASVAVELRHRNVAGVFKAVDAGSMVWPPFQGLVSACVLSVTGPDVRLAVIPSLVGFILTVVFAFLLARRMVPEYGSSAGLCAATLVLTSPAVRAYAADAMLESLGLGLGLVSLYAAIGWMELRTRRSAILLGLALTALYFQKYNYWLMIVAAVGVTFVGGNLRPLTAWVGNVIRAVPWRAWTGSQFRQPVNYLIVALLVLAGVTAALGGWSLELGGRTIEMKTVRVVVNAAYGLCLAKFALWWWTVGRHVAAAWLGTDGVALIYAHLVPAALWLAWPLRLQNFVWFLSPANAEHVYHDSFSATAEFYRTAAAGEYLPPSAGWVVAGLSLIAVIGWVAKSLRPGAGLVIVFLALATFLTLNHPNHKSRFLHTWLPVAFVLAGVGIATIARTCRAYGPAIAVLGTATVIAAFGPHAAGTGHATDRRGIPSGASLLDLTDAYLPELEGANRPMVLSNVCAPLWVKWSAIDRWGRADAVETDFRSIGWYDPVTPEVFALWLKNPTCDVIAFIDVPPPSDLYEGPPPSDANPLAEELLRRQTTFRRMKEIEVPDRGRISIWRRSE